MLMLTLEMLININTIVGYGDVDVNVGVSYGDADVNINIGNTGVNYIGADFIVFVNIDHACVGLELIYCHKLQCI
jgi:hypothetical protein